MASRMQDPRRAGGDMLFFARLDTTLAILDGLCAHFRMAAVRTRVMSDKVKVGQDMATAR
jgi:hypothetical protein